MRIVSFILLFVTYLFSNSDVEWLKLLYFQDNEYQVISKEFYLSEYNLQNPQIELKTTINLLNSQDGMLVACNFPARYQYIKQRYSVPIFDLSQCTELFQFYKEFQKKTVSIVFTSEYNNNPSSAFGHIMIVFSDNDISTGDTVHFAAKTSQEDGFFKYSYKGFSGQYSGHFIREPFFKKIYEYNILEQRHMFVYSLDFTQEQIDTLIYHLFELRKAEFKYYFMDGNCASRTTDLLDVVTDDKRQNSTYYLPIETVVSKQNNILTEHHFTPLIDKIISLYRLMTENERKIFYNTIQVSGNINKETPDIVKEALSYYYTYEFRRYHHIYKNYSNIMEQSYVKNNIKDYTINPLNKTKPSNLGVSIFSNKEHGMAINYRPLFIDLYDIQSSNIELSQVDILETEIFIDKSSIKLNELDLINIKSYTSQQSFYKPISWSVYSSINRENSTKDLAINNDIGFGKTLSIYDNTSISLLLKAGFENINPYIKPDLFLKTNLTHNINIGLSSYYKQLVKESYDNTTLFLNYQKLSNIYSFEFINDGSYIGNTFKLTYKYNF